MIQFKRCDLNLSKVALILNVISCTLRLVYIGLPSRAVYGSLESGTVTLVAVVLVYTSISLWLASTLLVVGFWYDAICKEMKVNLTQVTRMVVIGVSVVVALFTIVGMIMILIGLLSIGLVLILVPLIVTLIILIVYTVKIYQAKHLDGKNEEKRRWTVTVFIVLEVVWSIYIIALVITPAFNADVMVTFSIIPSILYRLCEAAISLLLMLMFDHRLRTIRRLFGKEMVSKTEPSTGTTRSNPEGAIAKDDTASTLSSQTIDVN